MTPDRQSVALSGDGNLLASGGQSQFTNGEIKVGDVLVTKKADK